MAYKYKSHRWAHNFNYGIILPAHNPTPARVGLLEGLGIFIILLYLTRDYGVYGQFGLHCNSLEKLTKAVQETKNPTNMHPVRT